MCVGQKPRSQGSQARGPRPAQRSAAGGLTLAGAGLQEESMRGGAVLMVLLASACSPPAGPGKPTGVLTVFPPPGQLPVLMGFPPLLTGADGTKVTSAEDFAQWRASELRSLFAHYVYGVSPPAAALKARLEGAPQPVLEGKGTYQELAVELAQGPVLHVALFLPAGVDRPPVILGLNKCGAQSLLADSAVRQTTGFLMSACDGGARGSQLTQWSLSQVLAAGFAVATFHDSDAAPDDSGERSAVAAAFPPGVPAAQAWGAIAIWSWSLSRVVDALVDSPLVDGKRIAVYGHSRRGKAALWAAANDARIAAVAAHQSGLAGAAPCRSTQGETVELINAFFPHWFAGNFKEFSNAEARLPVEQDALLALVSPRPLLLTDGDADSWANPPGALANARRADAVWELLGSAGLEEDAATGAPRTDATLVWRSRPGGHETTAADWVTVLEFLKRTLP